MFCTFENGSWHSGTELYGPLQEPRPRPGCIGTGDRGKGFTLFADLLILFYAAREEVTLLLRANFLRPMLEFLDDLHAPVVTRLLRAHLRSPGVLRTQHGRVAGRPFKWDRLASE